MVTPPVQDFPPPGGFPNTIKYARNLPRRGPSGAVVLAAVFGLMTYGFIKTGEGNAERRYILFKLIVLLFVSSAAAILRNLPPCNRYQTAC